MVLYDYINTRWRKARGDANGRFDSIVEKGSITPVQASGATQFALSDDASNETIVLHTVTGGKTFELVHWAVSYLFDGATIDTSQLFVTDNNDVLQYNIFKLTSSEVGLGSVSGSLPVPLSIPATYKIKLTSNDLGAPIWGFIHGYEI